jgi:hypothetical protein
MLVLRLVKTLGTTLTNLKFIPLSSLHSLLPFLTLQQQLNLAP